MVLKSQNYDVLLVVAAGRLSFLTPWKSILLLHTFTPLLCCILNLNFRIPIVFLIKLPRCDLLFNRHVISLIFTEFT